MNNVVHIIGAIKWYTGRYMIHVHVKSSLFSRCPVVRSWCLMRMHTKWAHRSPLIWHIGSACETWFSRQSLYMYVVFARHLFVQASEKSILNVQANFQFLFLHFFLTCRPRNTRSAVSQKCNHPSNVYHCQFPWGECLLRQCPVLTRWRQMTTEHLAPFSPLPSLFSWRKVMRQLSELCSSLRPCPTWYEQLQFAFSSCCSSLAVPLLQKTPVSKAMQAEGWKW